MFRHFAMTLMLGIFCWQIGLLAFNNGNFSRILVLGQIKKPEPGDIQMPRIKLSGERVRI